MRIFIFCILILSGLLTFGQKKFVCLSFDDMPVVSYGISDTIFQKDLMDKLIFSLKNDKIPAIGFLNEKKLHNNGKISSFQVGLVRKWINSGLDLGNHTYSHFDYNSVSFEEYSHDVLRGETIAKKLLADKGKSLKYFRHPFLHVGNTKAKADSLEIFLLGCGYTIAPVTIDNEDYLFASAYHRAKIKRDTVLMNRIGNDFIDYMEKKVKYYEQQSDLLFGRPISQIMLLHASALNSDYIDSLASMLRRNDYGFISMDKALTDSAYKSEITVYGKWGISWIDKWALSQGKKGAFFKDDPETPDYIKKLSE